MPSLSLLMPRTIFCSRLRVSGRSEVEVEVEIEVTFDLLLAELLAEPKPVSGEGEAEVRAIGVGSLDC